ncbi:MAG TPA: flagellar biosynthetic protein FliR [Chthonomonadales bacterium]|nr:flagellar biosynthetic protein FliR [Chthonomonadales bacterium]
MDIGVHEFWTFMLLFARVAALLSVAPVFGSRSVPGSAKVGLAALVSYALMPLVGSQITTIPTNLFTLLVQIAAETAVGLCLGFLVLLLMASFQIAGHFVDIQMGFGIINVLNPFSEQQDSSMGLFLRQLGMTLFLILGGHLSLIGALAQSYAIVAPGGAHFAGNLSGPFSDFVMQIFLLAVRIAAPATIVLLLVDVAFAIIARTMPQMNVFIVGLPAKIIFGLMTMAFVLPAMAMAVGEVIPLFTGGAQALLRGMR